MGTFISNICTHNIRSNGEKITPDDFIQENQNKLQHYLLGIKGGNQRKVPQPPSNIIWWFRKHYKSAGTEEGV